MAINEIQVGNGRAGVADGTTSTARAGKRNELIVTDGLPKYHEAVERGMAFSGNTAVAGVAPGTVLGTTSAFYLHNPTGSGKLIALVKASLGYLSGTLGAGATYLTTHAAGTPAAVPTGTVITPRNNLIGTTTGSVATCLTTATVITQVPVKPLWSFGAAVATTAFQPTPCEEYFEGEFIVYPGFGVGMHSIAAAGTAPLVLFGCTWIEVPLI